LKTIVAVLLSAVLLFAPVLPVAAQDVDKLRVLGAPGVTKVDPKDWHNSLSLQGKTLTLNCPKCSPTSTVTLAAENIATLRYGGNAYHHWVAGIVSGLFTVATVCDLSRAVLLTAAHSRVERHENFRFTMRPAGPDRGHELRFFVRAQVPHANIIFLAVGRRRHPVILLGQFAEHGF
jgi:hypothetical protein